MKIEKISLYPFQVTLKNGYKRSALLINIQNEQGEQGWGEVSPLPNYSKERVEACLKQFYQKEHEIIKMQWHNATCLKDLHSLNLLPALSFGLESALLSILAPVKGVKIPVAAFFMGSYQEILKQSESRELEGYTSAKLKVSQLNFEEAKDLIQRLKDRFRLRIDVNRAWSTEDSLKFFSQFDLDAFDYVEEPFQNPQDLHLFTHPLAIDESFPCDLSFTQLDSIPVLKSLIYKPTIQGGMAKSIEIYKWALSKKITLVMGSSFESDLGLMHVAAIAHRFSLTAPVGIGTFYCLDTHVCHPSLNFSSAHLYINTEITVAEEFEKLNKRIKL